MPKGEKSKLRRLAVLALVLMVAFQPAASGAVAASPDDDPCTNNIGLGEFKSLLGLDSPDCAAEKIQSITHADIYASGLAQSDLGKSSRTVGQNHLAESKTIARTIVKSEVAKAMQNGSNLSVAQTNVNESLDDYYSAMQKNQLSAISSNLNQAWYNFKSRENAGVDQTAMYTMWETADDTGTMQPIQYNDGNMYAVNETWTNKSNYVWLYDNQTVTLANGTNVSGVPYLQYKRVDTDTVQITVDPTNTTTTSSLQHGEADFVATKPDATGDQFVTMFEGTEYLNSWLAIEDTNQEMKTKGADYAQKVFNTYNQSEFDGLEILDPITLTRNFNTDYNSTGYYGWIAAELGMTGLEGDINSSFAVSYTPSANHSRNAYTGGLTGSQANESDYDYIAGESYNLSGTLYTDWEPHPNESYSFKRGETYDTANASTEVYFVEQVNANTTRMVALNGTFTVDELTDVRTGETLNNTTLQEQTQQTFNESSTIDEIEYLIEYRNRSTDINEAGGGGGGGFDWGSFDFGMASIGFLAVIGGAFVLILGKE